MFTYTSNTILPSYRRVTQPNESHRSRANTSGRRICTSSPKDRAVFCALLLPQFLSLPTYISSYCCATGLLYGEREFTSLPQPHDPKQENSRNIPGTFHDILNPPPFLSPASQWNYVPYILPRIPAAHFHDLIYYTSYLEQNVSLTFWVGRGSGLEDRPRQLGQPSPPAPRP